MTKKHNPRYSLMALATLLIIDAVSTKQGEIELLVTNMHDGDGFIRKMPAQPEQSMELVRSLMGQGVSVKERLWGDEIVN